MSPKLPPLPCPHCRSALTLYLAGRVEVDRCYFCGGTWFDLGELAELTGASASAAAADLRPGRSCPRCDLGLVSQRYEAVELEACPRCKGVFARDDQLQRLAGRALSFTPKGRAPVTETSASNPPEGSPASDEDLARIVEFLTEALDKA